MNKIHLANRESGLSQPGDFSAWLEDLIMDVELRTPIDERKKMHAGWMALRTPHIHGHPITPADLYAHDEILYRLQGKETPDGEVIDLIGLQASDESTLLRNLQCDLTNDGYEPINGLKVLEAAVQVIQVREVNNGDSN